MPESRRRRRRGRVVGRGTGASEELSMTRPRRRRTNYWYLAASATIAVLVIAGFALGSVRLGGGGGAAGTGSSQQFLEGVGVSHPIMANTYPNSHVLETESVSYSTTPPTSGKHWDQWAECGIYQDGLPDERITHNLEHGNIIISYNLSSSQDLSRLRSVLDDTDLYSAWGLARYYDEIDSGQVALSAWGVLDTMEGIDAERIQGFFDAYAGSISPETLGGITCRNAPFRMHSTR